MHTYTFLYKVPGDSAVHEMEVVSCSFLVAAEKFREVVENRHGRFDLVQAYGENGAPLYLGNPQEQFRDQFGARLAGGAPEEEPWQYLYGFDPADADLVQE